MTAATHKTLRQAAQDLFGQAMGSRLSQDSVDAREDGSIEANLPAVARQAAADGCVLLENDGTLPLSPNSSVAVFGRRQLDWIPMGHGSGGDVNAPYLTNLIDGLDGVGARYDHVLAELYRSWCTDKKNRPRPAVWGKWPQSLPEMPVTSELATAAAQASRTAIVVLGRVAGESQDLTPTAGSYYLSKEERALVERITSAFDHVVIVLDTCNLIDLSWIDEYRSHISAVLLAWPGGMEAGNAVADVLYGRVCPSGRLTDAVARSLDAHPSNATFGETDSQEYREGVFVGYRHLSTYAPYDIRYKLGHGLSYTTFSIEAIRCTRCGSDVRARLRVTNTGTIRGRETVILWCEPPRGVIDKPLLLVAAFAKTAALDPGASEEVELVAPLEDLAAFDCTRRAFVLEQGPYRFVANGTFVGKGMLDEDLVYDELDPICSGSDDRRRRIREHLYTLREAPAQDETVTFEDVASGREPLDALVGQLSPAELEGLTRGWGTMNSPLGPAGNAGVFGGVTPDLQRRGIPTLTCADGPSGIRLARRCSLIPCATALASTWDVELVQRLYSLVGHEAAQAEVDVLLAPGMNLHRSPLCGRNFEYFSEDPVLSGQMAAAVVRGLRTASVEACPKHFACNNQERNRRALDVRVDERTLREAYLRPFAICVRESRPKLIMTSYNKVNGIWSHYNFDLVTTVLRGEWGFDGVVMTDWWMQHDRSPEFCELRDNAYRVRSGIDVLMPGNMGRLARRYRAHRSLLESLGSPDGLTRAELQATARRVLALLLAKKATMVS